MPFSSTSASTWSSRQRARPCCSLRTDSVDPSTQEPLSWRTGRGVWGEGHSPSASLTDSRISNWFQQRSQPRRNHRQVLIAQLHRADTDLPIPGALFVQEDARIAFLHCTQNLPCSLADERFIERNQH